MIVNEIILHCSATVEGKPFTVADIDQWHKAKGWQMVGYHYVICLDGKVQKGRPCSMIGAHTVGHNEDSIGICYIGGIRKDGKPKDTRTPEQRKALFDLVYYLLDTYNLTIDDVHCHNEYSTKACPSFTIDEFREDYIDYLNTKLTNEKH